MRTTVQCCGHALSKKCTTGTLSAVQLGGTTVPSAVGEEREAGWQFVSCCKEAQRLQNRNEKESENIESNSIGFFFLFLAASSCVTVSLLLHPCCKQLYNGQFNIFHTDRSVAINIVLSVSRPNCALVGSKLSTNKLTNSDFFSLEPMTTKHLSRCRRRLGPRAATFISFLAGSHKLSC